MTSSTKTNQGTYRPYDPSAEDPVDLVWPTNLRRPTASPYLVYLDLNHWVGLADAAVGRPKGDEYRPLLAACRTAKDVGVAVFPLSATHYMEIAKIVGAERRANLAVIAEELSSFATLLARSRVMRVEMGAVIDRELGLPPGPPVDLLGQGVGHAFGHPNETRLADRIGVAATMRARRQFGPAYVDNLVAGAQLALERANLAGPRNAAEEASLQARGWIPDTAVKIAQSRADREIELQKNLDEDSRWRKGRLRDLVLARELVHEMWDGFLESLAARGITDLTMMHERAGARSFQRAIPSVEVITEMKTAKHRNASTKWDTNTIFDIDAMGLAVPYCDVVLTERDACSILRKAGFGDRMQTVLLSRPDELATWLAEHGGGDLL